MRQYLKPIFAIIIVAVIYLFTFLFIAGQKQSRNEINPLIFKNLEKTFGQDFLSIYHLIVEKKQLKTEKETNRAKEKNLEIINAIKIYKQSAAVMPIQMYVFLAECYLEAGQLSQALKTATECFNKYKNVNILAYNQLINVYLETEKDEKDPRLKGKIRGKILAIVREGEQRFPNEFYFYHNLINEKINQNKEDIR